MTTQYNNAATATKGGFGGFKARTGTPQAATPAGAATAGGVKKKGGTPAYNVKSKNQETGKWEQYGTVFSRVDEETGKILLSMRAGNEKMGVTSIPAGDYLLFPVEPKQPVA